MLPASPTLCPSCLASMPTLETPNFPSFRTLRQPLRLSLCQPILLCLPYFCTLRIPPPPRSLIRDKIASRKCLILFSSACRVCMWLGSRGHIPIFMSACHRAWTSAMSHGSTHKLVWTAQLCSALYSHRLSRACDFGSCARWQLCSPHGPALCSCSVLRSPLKFIFLFWLIWSAHDFSILLNSFILYP